MVLRIPPKVISTAGKIYLRSGRGLASSPQTTVSTLPNGLRVATENTNLPTATIGVWIDAGSRYENLKNNGTAHFLEHMAFKGTERRSQHDLEMEVENMGAHLNAYTSREQTVYYAKCFSKHLEKSVDILSDILLHSRLGEKEVERERGVILREAEEVAQNMQEVVFDHLHSGAFKGSSLAMTILGPDENIKCIQRCDLSEYISTHYMADRMVVAGSGGLSHSHVVDLAEKYFGRLPSSNGEAMLHDGHFTPCQIHLPVTGLPLVYGAICVGGVSWSHPDNLSMMVANTMLGEWDRSRGSGVNTPSRLAHATSLLPGVQSFQAFNTCYKDTGILGVYFVCEGSGVRPLLREVLEEWKWMAFESDSESVERAKQSLLTNLQLMLDGSTPVCEDIGRQLLCYGRRLSMDELRQRIEAITLHSLRQVASRVLLSSSLATTAVGDVSSLPSNAEMESSLRGQISL